MCVDYVKYHNISLGAIRIIGSKEERNQFYAECVSAYISGDEIADIASTIADVTIKAIKELGIPITYERMPIIMQFNGLVGAQLSELFFHDYMEEHKDIKKNKKGWR